jgi:DeoR/GlpR family transcriptional regulator of sugar metabolism
LSPSWIGSLARFQRAVLVKLHDAGEHTIAELAELFSVSRATVYREIARAERQN